MYLKAIARYHYKLNLKALLDNKIVIHEYKKEDKFLYFIFNNLKTIN